MPSYPTIRQISNRRFASITEVQPIPEETGDTGILGPNLSLMQQVDLHTSQLGSTLNIRLEMGPKLKSLRGMLNFRMTVGGTASETPQPSLQPVVDNRSRSKGDS